MQLLCESQDLYSQQKYEFGFEDIPFEITFKPDSEREGNATQKLRYNTETKNKRFSKNQRAKGLLNNERVELDAPQNNEMVSELVIFFIILPKRDTNKIAFDARLHNKKTDVTKSNFQLLPARVLKPRNNGTFLRTIDVSKANDQLALTQKNETFFRFVNGHEQEKIKLGSFPIERFT